MYFHFVSIKATINLFIFSLLVKFSLTCENKVNHLYNSSVVSFLRVTVRSHASDLASILVDNENYTPQSKGYNVAVFDPLSGRFLTSAAFDCAARQAECDKLGVFLKGLPQDVVVLLAAQGSAVVSGHVLPTRELKEVGAKQTVHVSAQTRHAVIGYKGQTKGMTWTKENRSDIGLAEVSSSIPIRFSYRPKDSIACTTFNVASHKYGGSCLNQSSSWGALNSCQHVLDGDTNVGWNLLSKNESVNSSFTVGFHSTFVINKIRISQNASKNQQIQEMLLEFSDSTMEKITLKENRSDFEEFFFTSRRACWVKFTITEVNGGSSGVGIQEIEIYDEKCYHKTFCDTIQLSDHSRSNHYRLQSNQFPLMIEAEDDVLVLLTSDSRGDDYHFKIEIGSNGSIALSKMTNEYEQRFKSNVTLLKANETRLFWLDIQTDRLVFGSGGQIYLFWREAKPIRIKYAVFNTTTSSASFQICPLMGVVKRLNITVKSESSQTPDRNLPNGLAFIWVNNENYAPQTKGYNVAVFDALTGRVLTSAAFDCAESQKECDKLGAFLKDLPQDVIILLAVQDSGVGSYTLPTSDLIGIGAQKAGRVVGQTSHAVIGYKGWRGVTWIKEDFKQSGGEPAEVSSSIPISFLYLPEDSTTCTPFNVASRKYGGSCLNQSSSKGASNGCEKVLDESTTLGWEPSTNESVNSFLEIGFHSTFTINKLRIIQKTTSGRRIHRIVLEFSDHSLENITLTENSLDFEEFTFSFRKAHWVKFTIMEVYNGNGGVGIQEIEFYNGMCKQNTICDALQLLSDSKSVPYRLHSTRFPLMINSRDKVSVLLTATSRVISPLYKIEIVANGDIILKSKDDEIKQVMKSNVTLLKENETRLFWVEILTDQMAFGSGEKIYLFWREAKPTKTKYASFSTTRSSAVIQVCARLDHCYKDASHYWPLDKSVVYQQDMKSDGSLVGKIHGPWTIHHLPANLIFTPLALSLSGSHSWVDLRSVEKSEQSCQFSPLHCNNGISVSFKANLSTNRIGYILSSGGKSSTGFSIYHVDGVMHFNVRDGQNIWQVQGSYENNAWHTFAMSWSHADGLTAVIGGDSTNVLRDTRGKTVTLTQASHSSLIIGRSTNMDGGVHADIVLRDVAIWEEAIAEERMSTLFVCNDLESCNPGWQYFDGSCYKVMTGQLAFSTARDSCRNEGGELVKISSEEENNYVKAIANNAQSWIGLEKKAADNSFSWTDGSGLSFSELDGSIEGNFYCVRMKDDGRWTITHCSGSYASICEQIPWDYLGCYEDSIFSPRFVFNPGGYRGSRMTTGLCLHSCGTLNFTYAALRGGNICLCSNSTANVTEGPRDLCLSACLGAGNLKCGGGSYLSVYKSVQMQPLNLELSSDSSAVVLKAFNLKMKPSLSEDQIVESFKIIVGDGVEFLNYNETKSEATLLFIHPGNHTVIGKANVKHTKTGHRLAVESTMTELAVSNITDIELICPAVYPVNFTFRCFVQFRQGRNVNATIKFEGVEYNSGFVPDAMIMTAGVTVSDPGGQDTSDGLYLLPTVDVTNKGKAVAFKMEVGRGGFLEMKVYRPKCLDSKQRYCRAKRMCVSSVLYSNVCPAGETDNTVGNKKFSFAGAQCVKEDGSFSGNNTTAQANFDYENISSCMIQTTSGHKVVLVESCTQRLEIDEGDVIAVQFPSSKPAAAIKTSLCSISLFYNESLSNGTEVLRSNRRPATASSPTELHHAPVVAILYTALSGRSFDHVYKTYGNKSVSLTVENSHRKLNFTAQTVVQEPIRGLQLSLPDAFALGESVNVTTDIAGGTDIRYYWQFSDGINNTTVSPFVTRVFKNVGEVDVFVFATNDVSSAAVRCSVDVQERIEGFKFKNNSLLPVEYEKTVSIFWLLRQGSHVNFNFSITSKEGVHKFNKDFPNAKTVDTILFSVYKTTFSIPDLYFITIIAANKVNNLTLRGNLSVEQNLTSIEMNFTRLVKTNRSFDFIMLPHQGNRTAIYTLNITREIDPIETTQKINGKCSVLNDDSERFENYPNITITCVCREPGKYSVTLSVVNDISSLFQNHSIITVQDEIKDFLFDDNETDIIVQSSSDRVNISWSLAKGTDVSIVVDYGDGNKTDPWVIPNNDILHDRKYRNTIIYDYKEAGKYNISFKAKNLVSENQLSKTVYVDPYELNIRCEQCIKEGNRSVANPSSKLTFKGDGKTRGGKPINFNWKVNNCSTDGKDCSVPMDLKDYNSTPLDWKYLVIKPDKLQGDILYKIILVGQVDDHGRQRTKQLLVRANTPPSKGNCTVTPTEGQALKTLFNLTCNGFTDNDKPLRYEFLYSKSLKDLNQSLGSGLDPWQNNVVLPSGENITIYAKVSDSVGAITIVTFTPAVKVKTLNVGYEELTKETEKLLNSAKGDMRRTTSIVLTAAEVLNEKSASARSNESEEEKKVEEKLSDLYKNSSQTILDIATDKGVQGVPSEELREASTAVLNGAVNLIKTVNLTRGEEKLPVEDSNTTETNTTGKVIGTLDRLSEALVISMVDGEEPTIIDNEVLSMGVSLEGAEFIGKKPYKVGNGQVKIAEGSLKLGDEEILKQVSILSAINLFPEGNDSGRLNDSKLVGFSLYKVDTKNNRRKDEYGVKNLATGNESSVIIPLIRAQLDRRFLKAERKLFLSQHDAYSFEIKDNISTVTFEVTPEAPVDVEILVTMGREPNISQRLFDFNATFLAEDYLLQSKAANLSNSTTLQSYSRRLLLADNVLNLTVAGRYFAKVIFKKPKNLTWLPDEIFTGEINYNISVYRSRCMFFDKGNNAWSSEGVKVGRKTNLTHVECLTSHLTTFGSDFFVPPNRLDFNFSPQTLLQSPHALIAVCTILGLYFLCLIFARRADKNDALKAGVTPLPDNDSRDTYCYQIQVHTGFIRGAGTSAEVSIVLTGALGDSEPRLLKDPKRKTFRTGGVDAFLMIVPQSLGNLKQIRVWHNNDGTFPSWNLLRIMIQDIQTDQRWWFVCDGWLAVEEGDGKIERTLFPASKKELTKFNVLFASEVRKNLTDGHIWFSVVARPPQSTFTRVQRLTCCLSILLCTMLANAMFYEVGKNKTTKNAIKIMGFSFSIRSVSIGIMSSLVVFPVNLTIATIFRKARPKENQYKVKTGTNDTDNVDVETTGEKKTAPASKGLPHWFVYLAYGLAFLSVTSSGSFVIMYGMQFGPEKSGEWLSSMAVSFLQDVLLTQPIKVFILAILFALLIKDPKKAEDDTYADINALAKDEEWLHMDITDLNPETQKTMRKIIDDRPPEEAKLEIARQLRLKEKQMSSIIQEISWYIVFLLVLLTISYMNRDLDTSRVTQHIRNTFERAGYSGNLTYDKVNGIKHYWRWLSETFIPSLKPEVFYNNSTRYQKGYLADIPTAFLLGVARLRQLRIRKDTCVYKRVSHDITECNDFYSIKEEDQGWYLPGWKATPTTAAETQSPSSPRQTSQLKDPWVYRSGEELKTFSYWGYKGTYSGGGYVQTFPNDQNVDKLLKMIKHLSVNNWLDRYTRAVFSEFAIYNANTNLFCVVTLLFEQLPTGSLSPYPSILTLRLFRYVGGEKAFVITCEVVYFLFTLFFVVKEVKLLLKRGRVHLKNPWSILEILVTLLSLSAVGMYFARLKFTKDALRDMRNDRAGFISFHYTAFLDEWLKCIMGVIVFLSFLKMFRLLRFNRRMSMLQQVLKRSFSKLMSFVVMFALAFLAFAFLACLVFGQEMGGFGTFWRSCASLMDTLLGKFTLKKLSTANRILGPIFFYTYTVTMLFVLLNVFLSIINDAFAEVCSDVEKQSNDYEIVDFIVHRLKETFGRTDGHAILPVYKEPKSKIEANFDKITDDADNATHFMRNIAFEDMRVTRWFQLENCTEKKKNLMRLLVEVDWDFHEDELCDSIPVFERFLNKYRDEELESILQHYRLKRIVENLVFDEVNTTGEFDDSSHESDSVSEDSNKNSHRIVSDDEKMVDDLTLMAVDGFSDESRRQSSLGTESGTIGTQSPSLSIFDAVLVAGLATVMSGNELIQALKDAQREVEHRWASHAEIATGFEESSSLDDISSPRFDSEPGNIDNTNRGVDRPLMKLDGKMEKSTRKAKKDQ